MNSAKEVEEVRSLVMQGVPVVVTFLRMDGAIRVMECFFDPDMAQRLRNSNGDLLLVFDVAKEKPRYINTKTTLLIEDPEGVILWMSNTLNGELNGSIT